MKLPRLYKVRQLFETPEIKDIETTIVEQLDGILRQEDIQGKKVAITAGSRGFSNAARIYKTVVQYITENQGTPYLIAAMGSHGGGNVEGQLGVLKGLGITEDSIGCKFLASIKANKVGSTPCGIPAYCNEITEEVDKIIILNRVKEHTDFSGVIESGLHKMLTIGLGTYEGADIAHINAMKYGYFHTITEVAKVLLHHLDILCGIGIVENEKNETYKISAVKSDAFWDGEVKLLQEAKKHSARIPFDVFDILLIKEIGKNISGGGLDSKVIGRIRELGQTDPEYPDIKRISIFGVSEESKGNFCGLGLGDFSTLKVFKEISDTKTMRDTVLNCVVSMTPEYATIPCIVENEQEMIFQTLRCIGGVDPVDAKLVYIKNTKELENIFITEALLEEAKNNGKLKIYDEHYDFQFNENHDMIVPML